MTNYEMFKDLARQIEEKQRAALIEELKGACIRAATRAIYERLCYSQVQCALLAETITSAIQSVEIDPL